MEKTGDTGMVNEFEWDGVILVAAMSLVKPTAAGERNMR
jgi:hypothetical protein